jgi:hypothetical protein
MLAGIVLPILAFGVNELIRGAPGDVVPDEKRHHLARLGQLWTPTAQRGFYPVLAWAIVAYGFALMGRRAPWIRVGVWGGAFVAFVFALLYLPLLPLSLMGIMALGLGLLGLSPYFTTWSYVAALLRYERDGEHAERPDDRETCLRFAALWVGLAGVGVVHAIERMNALWAALPDENPRCFLATAAARGDPRVTGARPFRTPNGHTFPVSHQLRVFKTFEIALAAFTPRAHRLVRAIYDRVGPLLASRITPRTATLLHVALVPSQGAAMMALRLVFANADALVARTYRH